VALDVGPTYIDVAIPSGKYKAKFGPASNNLGPDGRGDPNLRVRVDRLFSDVPFRRMVAALGQLMSVPTGQSAEGVANKRIGVFQLDNLLKEAMLSTFAIKDDGMLMDGMSNPSLGDLVRACLLQRFQSKDKDRQTLFTSCLIQCVSHCII